MDYIYKSSFYHDLDGHREFTRSYHEGTSLTRCLLVVYSILAVWWVTLFDSPSFVYRFLLIITIVLVVTLINNSKKGDIQFKRMLQANSGEPVRQEQYFLETGLHVVSMPNGNHFDFAYEQIRLVIESKNLILLVMKHRSCIILDKSTLSGGNIDQFFAFLKARCPKLKGKNPRKTTLGMWLRRIFTVILILGSIWALLNLPFFSIADRLFERLHNDIQYQQMADELSEMGISICSRTILEMEEYDENYLQETGYGFYDGAGRYQKVADLLYWEGAGIYDQLKGWDPSNSGIFWVGYWSDDGAICYGDFFEGLHAMDKSLIFENISENLDQLDERGFGPVTVTFEYLGESYTIDIEDDPIQFDESVIRDIGKIVDSNTRHLYVCHDQNEGMLLYYGTAQEVRTINRRTTLQFRKAAGML